MGIVLNEFELRALGSLIEKQISTPDYYPLTLNAVINACNQKNHRDPVVSYDEQTVVRSLDGLREKKLVYTFHGSEARVPKYGHLFPKAYELNEAEVALLCVLMLRGPQTPGELRARTAHLYNFEQLSEVESTLQNLASREQPLIIKLSRQPGARESRYAHLISGDISVEEVIQVPRQETANSQEVVDKERIARLEEELTLLRQEFAELSQQFSDFKKQFE